MTLGYVARTLVSAAPGLIPALSEKANMYERTQQVAENKRKCLESCLLSIPTGPRHARDRELHRDHQRYATWPSEGLP
jgi:hypothetical protein